MLINFNKLYLNYKLNITGILHIGGHLCEEINDYEKYVPRNKILWIEAIPENVDKCKIMYDNLLIENEVVSDITEETNFYISNNGQSSSMLELGLHRNLYPDIYYKASLKIITKPTFDVIKKYTSDIKFNFINLDIQGTELKALKGLGDYLNNVDYIYTEVNSDYVYKNCALIDEIDEYLSKFGFKRIEVYWVTNYNWGDAFYIKS